jgi:ADP-ribose pyrophosphatase YjhB (NUDIX family)
MNHPTHAARDGEEFDYRDGAGQDLIVSWHPPTLRPPSGTPHGAAGICFTSNENVVLVSFDGERWGFPGGRPEGDEDLRATLDREVLEEACARVEKATLLGFSKGVCIRGPEKGLVLVRSLWQAGVSLLKWDPQHETTRRQVVPSDTALERVEFGHGLGPIFHRWFQEALAAACKVPSCGSTPPSRVSRAG